MDLKNYKFTIDRKLYVVILNKIRNYMKRFSEEPDNRKLAQLRGVSFTKFLHDHFNSKIVEFIVVQYLYDVRNYPLIEPDLNVYKRGEKSWIADLVFFDHPNVNIKSCNQYTRERWGESYTFQTTDKIFTGSKNDEKLLLAYRSEKTPAEITIRAMMDIKEAFEHELFEDPQIKKYIGEKKCIYLSTLQGILIE